MNNLKIGFVMSVMLIGTGCASAPPPTEQLASAEASLRAAQELGAQREPKAELHMRLAREQVVTARKLAEDGENERAAMILTRARADAELAIAISRQSDAQRDLAATKSPETSSITSPTPVTQATR